MLRLAPLFGVLLTALACGGNAPHVPLADEVQSSTELELDANNLRELVGVRDASGDAWLAAVQVPIYAEEREGHVVLLRPSGQTRTRLGGARDDLEPTAEVVLASGPAIGPVALTAFGPDEVYAVWEARTPTGRALFGRAARWADGELLLADVEPLPATLPINLAPSVAAVGGGALVAAWQALDGARYVVHRAQRGADGRWQHLGALAVGDAATDHWAPRVAAGALDARATPGPHWLAFDHFSPGAPNGFDVTAAHFATPDAAPTLVRLDSSPADAMYPELAVDATGRAWVAFEVVPDFGMGGALRDARRPVLAAATPDGGHQVADLTALDAEPQRGDFPRLALSPAGVALARRIPKNDFMPRSKERKAFYATWHTYLTRFEGARPHDLELVRTDGDNTNEAVLLASPTGLDVYVLTDLRETTFASRYTFDSTLENPALVRHLAVPGTLAFPALGPPPMALMGGPAKGRAPAERSPHYAFGDLHRHTSLSRCAGRRDGTFIDQVRYARGPGALDFLSVTDHFQHVSVGSLWLQQRDLTRFDAPGSLALLPGLERMVMKHSHQNLVWRDVADMTATHADTAPESLQAGTVVAIPHMTAIGDNPFPWSALVPELHRLVEIHQGLRGSYEGAPLGERFEDVGELAWPRAAVEASTPTGWITNLPSAFPIDGAPPGLISASDHGSSSRAFAGIALAPGTERAAFVTRERVFEQLVAGAAFASTGPARAPYGLELLVEGDALVVRAHDGAPAEVTVFENGGVWQTSAPDGLPHLLISAFPGVSGNGTLHVERKLADGSFVALGSVPFAEELDNTQTLALDAWPAADDVLRFRLDFEQHAASEELVLSWADLAEARRYKLRPDRARPLLMLSRFVPSAGGEADTFEARHSLEGRPADALYYARMVHADGEVTWSRFVRGNPSLRD